MNQFERINDMTREEMINYIIDKLVKLGFIIIINDDRESKKANSI